LLAAPEEGPPARPPAPLRVVAGAGAVGVAAILALEPAAWLRAGCAWTAAAAVASALPLLAFLVLLAIFPAALERPLARWTRVDLADGGHVAAAIVMAASLTYLAGGSVVSATATIESTVARACAAPAAGGGPGAGEALLFGVVVSLLLFSLPVLFYVGIVHARGPAGTLRALGLVPEGAARAAAIGVAVAIVFELIVVGLQFGVCDALPAGACENPLALDIAQSLTPLGAFAVALASAAGEEIFFRGFLQPRIGLVAASTFFALAHVSYGSVSEVAVVFALALVLAFLYRRTGNLVAPMATHFAFNLVNLLAGAVAR